jgi:hypothetical protein
MPPIPSTQSVISMKYCLVCLGTSRQRRLQVRSVKTESMTRTHDLSKILKEMDTRPCLSQNLRDLTVARH